MVDRRLLALYASTTALMMTFGLLSPFLPLVAAAKHVGSEEVGVIYSVYSIGGLISSPIVGSLLHRFGRRNTLLGCYLMNSLAFLSSGVSVYLDHTEFVVLNVISRFLTGAAASTLFTVDNAIIASDYPDKVLKYVGINESCCGLAFVIGPIVGAGLYLALEAAGTFFCASAFYFLFGLLTFFLLGPDRPYRILNKDQHIFALAARPMIFLALLPLIFYMFAIGGIVIFFPTHLKSYGLSDATVVASYTLTGVGYLLVTIILAHTLETMNQTLVTGIALVIGTIGVAFLGPFPAFIPQNLYFVLTGWFFLPLCSGALFVIIMPSLIEVATQDYHLVNDDKLLDQLSAIESLAMAAGEMVGPLVTGWVLPYSGVRDWCGVLAAGEIVVMVVYVGAFVWVRRKQGDKKELLEGLERGS